MIREVQFRTILDAPNAESLLAEYAAECSLPELGTTNPNAEMYSRLEAGGMRTLAVYDGEILVGFATLLTYILPHYGKKVAATESIFVAAEHRPRIGNELVDFIEQEARKNDCAAVLYSAPAGSRFSRMLSLLPKYRHSNDVYVRKLQ